MIVSFLVDIFVVSEKDEVVAMYVGFDINATEVGSLIFCQTPVVPAAAFQHDASKSRVSQSQGSLQ